jgi:predicted house-cleaning noncanonical NTP pyrophosphatase (MazG superfamily)
MGWKLVRDNNEAWCNEHGVSGTWKRAEDFDAVYLLLKKIFEEAGEYAESMNPAELYDLLDVIYRTLELTDADRAHAAAHAQKVAQYGMFDTLTIWSPCSPDTEFKTVGEKLSNA